MSTIDSMKQIVPTIRHFEPPKSVYAKPIRGNEQSRAVALMKKVQKTNEAIVKGRNISVLV